MRHVTMFTCLYLPPLGDAIVLSDACTWTHAYLTNPTGYSNQNNIYNIPCTCYQIAGLVSFYALINTIHVSRFLQTTDARAL
jgi:hypothetical protein